MSVSGFCLIYWWYKKKLINMYAATSVFFTVPYDVCMKIDISYNRIAAYSKNMCSFFLILFEMIRIDDVRCACFDGRMRQVTTALYPWLCVCVMCMFHFVDSFPFQCLLYSFVYRFLFIFNWMCVCVCIGEYALHAYAFLLFVNIFFSLLFHELVLTICLLELLVYRCDCI